MLHPSPRITTINRRTERSRRLEDTRWPAARRRFLRAATRTLSLAAALAVMLNAFPPLLDAARTHPVVPRSFLTAEERMERKQSAKEPAEQQELQDETLPASFFEDAVIESRQENVPENITDGISDDMPNSRPDNMSDNTPDNVPDNTADHSLDAEEQGIPELIILPFPDDAAEAEEPQTPEPDDRGSAFLMPRATADTFHLTDIIEESAIKSQFAVLIDAQTGEILAERASDTLMNPASMTKVLTLLTAAECLTRPDGTWDLDSYTWNTKEISEYCWVNDCSMAWFTVGEWVPVRDTLYGMILPSGADAALMLANYAAGSQEAMVEKMNLKARELGLSEGAHFENCVGLYGESHVCTVQDMAVIMKAAMDHPVCRTVLGKESWTTSQTEEHPDGIVLVNRFLRRIKSQDSVLTVTGAKTGYVRQAGNCAVSMARRADGREYICVTAKGPGSSQVIQDHAALYRMFAALPSPQVQG